MTKEKSKIPITNHLRNTMSAGNLDIDDLFDAHEELELAANKLYSQLSIWVNTANTAACGYTNMKDLEALAEFELLRKP